MIKNNFIVLIFALNSASTPISAQQVNKDSDWSLPFSDVSKTQQTLNQSKKIIKTNSSTTKNSAGSMLKSGVVIIDEPQIVKDSVENLVDSAYNNLPESTDLDTEINTLATKNQLRIVKLKDSLNYLFDYQGCTPSASLAKFVLNRDGKYKDLYMLGLKRQQIIDKLHENIVASLMQISEAMGEKDDTKQNRLLSQGIDKLSKLVGRTQALNAAKSLNDYFMTLQINKKVFSSDPWNNSVRQNLFKDTIIGAVRTDPVLAEVQRQFQRYAKPGKYTQATNSTIQTTLNAASFLSPGLIIPGILQVALTGFVASTGGSEQNKIKNQFLLDKRVQSRTFAINNEVNMALDNYRFAQVTKNACLLSFSRSMLGYLAGRDSSKILKEVDQQSLGSKAIDIADSNQFKSD